MRCEASANTSGREMGTEGIEKSRGWKNMPQGKRVRRGAMRGKTSSTGMGKGKEQLKKNKEYRRSEGGKAQRQGWTRQQGRGTRKFEGLQARQGQTREEGGRRGSQAKVMAAREPRRWGLEDSEAARRTGGAAFSQQRNQGRPSRRGCPWASKLFRGG